MHNAAYTDSNLSMTMQTPLTLQLAALRCTVRPELGGCIAGLWWNDLAILRTMPTAPHSVRESASYPLVPYSNRIGHGQLQWAGSTYRLPLNFAPEEHSIHGVGWERPWHVLDADARSVRLMYQHPGDAAWPFAFDAVQELRLTADALDQTMCITNRAAQAAPAGLGWHPYFTKPPGTRIRFAAQARWDMGADKLPTQRLPHSGLQQGCDTLTVDHCFDGWLGALTLEHSSVRVSVSSDLDKLVVFTTPTRDNIAVEPVSHVNNALGPWAQAASEPQALGVRVLPPGASFSASMRVRLEALA